MRVSAPLRTLLAAALLALLAAPAPAQSDAPVPARRLVEADGLDYFGGDLRTLLDTPLAECRAACLADSACTAFTWNARASACFPKAGVDEVRAFDGAVSGRVLDTDKAVLAAAAARAGELGFLDAADLAAARALADTLSSRFRADSRDVAALIASANELIAGGNRRGAAAHLAAAVTISDNSAHWHDLSGLWRRQPGDGWQAERRLREDALGAAVNAYLRSRDAAAQARALNAIAEALETLGRGRATIPALRLAQALAPDAETATALDRAIGLYGFRIVDTQVESDAAEPRICAVFSDPVAPGVDFTPYVALPGTGLAVTAEGAQVCVSGLVHGQRYALGLRAGLPAASGEVLAKSVEIAHYVRDRGPRVTFPAGTYVLARGAVPALPVTTVNAPRLNLALARVADANILRTMQEGSFAAPLENWRIERFEAEIGEVIWQGTAETAGTLNRDTTTRLPLDGIGQALAPGLYTLTATVSGEEAWRTPPATQWFVVTDIGLSTLSGSDGLHVFARSLGSAAGLAGVRLALVSAGNRVLGQAVTDAAGHAAFAPGLLRGEGAGAPGLLRAEGAAGDDMAFLALTGPEFDLSDRGVAGRAVPGPVDVFATAERGAWRPGETIHLTVLARDGDGRAVAGVPLTLRLIRPDGVEHTRLMMDDAGDGGHLAAVPLPGGAPRGTWRAEVLADPDAAPLANLRLLVEDFLPERIDLGLTLPEGPADASAPLPLGVQADYLFGLPAAGLAVTGEVRLEAVRALDAFPGYLFGPDDAAATLGFETLPAGLVTGPDGGLRVAAPLPLPAPDGTGARPLRVDLRVQVADTSVRPVERLASRPLDPAAPVVGLRPLFGAVVPDGMPARFEVLAVGPGNAPVPARLGWQVDRIETHYQWYELYGEWQWEPVTLRTRVASGEVAVDGSGPAALSVPLDPGEHEVRVERLDGPYAAATHRFWAGWFAPAEAPETPDALPVALDRANYAPGDVARLRIDAREGGQVLVAVMADRLIDWREVAVAAGKTIVELPVTDAWGAGAYVWATWFRPMAEPGAATAATPTRGPGRAMGIAHATVAPGDRRLEAAFEVAPEATPRGPLPVALAVSGAAPGERVQAVVMAVDAGILNLTGFTPPDPGAHFFGQRRLGIGLRDLYGRLIDPFDGQPGIVRSGGDAALLHREGPPPTEELLAIVRGPLTVGPDGRVHTTLDLPAFNGTLRLMAVVWSGRGIGQASADVLVRDPVVVAATLPRFLAPGDTARLLVEFSHLTGPAGAMTLEASARNAGADGGAAPVALGPVPASVTLAPGGRVAVEVEVAALAEGLAEIDIVLTTPDGRRLARTLALPVAANDPAVARQSRFSLAAGKRFRLDAAAFAGLVPGTGRATLALGPMARFDVAGLMQRLDAYPWRCTEQVTSRALPLLYLAQVGTAMGLGSAADIAARIDAAVAAVLLNQASDGGFGLWQALSGDLWLDAYVTDFLSRARAQGHAVPQTAFRSALDNLRNAVNAAPDFERGGEGIAYALMVLAREGAAAMGDLRYYADVKADAFATPLALAQLGAALAQYGDRDRAGTLFARAGRAAVTAATAAAGPRTPFRADYGTALRDAAAVLALAGEADLVPAERAALAEAVAFGTNAGGALSTQEAMWTLMAAHAEIDRPGGAGFTLNGVPVTGPLVRVVDADALAGGAIEVANGSGAAAQLTLTTFGVPEVAAPAGGTGYAIRRSHYTLDGAPADIGRVAAGTQLVAVLEIEPLGSEAARLMVTDPLPAGFEIEVPSLVRSGDVAGLGWLDSLAETKTAEFRQDRFLAAVDWEGTRPFRLAYRLRATTPGSYRYPAASVEDMYRPERRAITATGTVTVMR